MTKLFFTWTLASRNQNRQGLIDSDLDLDPSPDDNLNHMTKMRYGMIYKSPETLLSLPQWRQSKLSSHKLTASS